MICGAETCNLGAMIHGAEVRDHFLKSFRKGSTCENHSKKVKNQKRRYNNIILGQKCTGIAKSYRIRSTSRGKIQIQKDESEGSPVMSPVTRRR
jgi:hypothetical protein